MVQPGLDLDRLAMVAARSIFIGWLSIARDCCRGERNQGGSGQKSLTHGIFLSYRTGLRAISAFGSARLDDHKIGFAPRLVNIKYIVYIVYMARKATPMIKKLITISPEMLDEIDAYRFSNRIKTELEAIRKLLAAGLKAERKKDAKS
jgi:hypothetical protein